MVQVDLSIRTDLIVLRLTPYQDNAVIVNGISPEVGRMGLFLRNSNPTRGLVDLFQIINFAYRRGQGDLYYPSDVEFSADYGALSVDYPSYQAACAISAFVLEHCADGTPMPRLFQALQVALIRLRDHCPLPQEALLTGIGLTLLNEGGWMTSATMAPEQAAQCELLLRMAAGGDFPALTAENWRELWGWTQAVIDGAER